jgi:E1A/CREB-binding protein
MMTQTLQGKVMAYTPSSFPVQQQILPEDIEMLQLDNMNQNTSPIRAIIIEKM